MTVPEENRRKTETTDDVLETRNRNQDENEKREKTGPRPPGATGRTMREALQEAEVRPDDYEE